jgi:class 3 adenylate cyclase
MAGPDSPVRRTVLEGHDGTVAKFVGDAVRAVFGFALAHEDDALWAVPAASEMRLTLAALNLDLKRDYGAELELRTSISSGEVVAGAGGR